MRISVDSRYDAIGNASHIHLIHKLLARLLPADYFIVHRDYFEAWQAIRLAKQPALASDVGEAIELLKPVGCVKPLIRIGGDCDGAYLIPDDLSGIAACFSPGTDNKIGFETELADHFAIPSLMCDGSVHASELKLNQAMHRFEQRWLKDFDGKDAHSLDHWVQAAPVAADRDLMLQIDIESGEYAALQAASQSTLRRFRIIAMEIHGLERLDDKRFLNFKFMPMMLKLSSLFDLVHVHPNNCLPAVDVCGYRLPPILELTFLRKDRNCGARQPVSLPHPLDIINVPSKPPVSMAQLLPSIAP